MELLAFAALAAENVTARLAGDENRQDFDLGCMVESRQTGACCEFSVADCKFAVDFTEWCGASPLLNRCIMRVVLCSCTTAVC